MNPTNISGGIAEHFGSLRDPRLERTQLHKLIDILVIAICGVICSANSWEEVEAFGEAKEDWFREFLELPNGIPSHDTFNRVFARLDAKQFEACFLSWMTAVSEITKGQVIALDGKMPRGSRDGALGKGAIDIVSAWATENSLVLGQVKVNEKSNEITAIPELLSVLELSGCIDLPRKMWWSPCEEQVLMFGSKFEPRRNEEREEIFVIAKESPSRYSRNFAILVPSR